MKIERWGNNIVIPVSQQELEERGLNIGDEVSLTLADAEAIAAAKEARRKAALERIDKMARPLPADWKFNRAELYEDEGRG